MKNDKEPVIILTHICNHRCVFCSKYYDKVAYGPKEIRDTIKNFKNTVSIEGGEPTLAPDLFKWIKYAKKAGVKDIILATNSQGLSDRENVKKLLAAGITLFNINLPSHIPELYETITRAKDYEKTLAGIRNAIDEAGGRRVRLTYVLNSISYKFLRDYVRFVKKVFPELFYIEVNMVKSLGAVTRRKWLIPKLSQIEKNLYEGFREARKLKIKCISDGFPLCYMKGFEEYSIDAYKIIKGDATHMSEKMKAPVCEKCASAGLCAGPRKDYLELYGASELKPASRNNTAAMTRKIKKFNNLA